MIAMALANRPKLLIADEPTTALDVTIQAQILELLADIQREDGLAILFINHNLGIVRHIAKRTYVMQKGAVVEHGETATPFANPAYAYTRKLLDAAPTGQPTPVAPDAKTVLTSRDLLRGLQARHGLSYIFISHNLRVVRAVSHKVLVMKEGNVIEAGPVETLFDAPQTDYTKSLLAASLR